MPTSDPFSDTPSCVLFVALTVPARPPRSARCERHGRPRQERGIGSADTFRAAAIEQLDVGPACWRTGYQA
ncbi:MAG: hypothetical protein ACLTYW_02160 [Collinsella sp.]